MTQSPMESPTEPQAESPAESRTASRGRTGATGDGPKRRGFSVAPSPLNVVKLDLAILLLVGVLLLVVHGKLVSGPAAQLLLLGGYGTASMLWLVVRTRRVLRNALARDP